ncbi:cytochrome c3 family protein [Breoghania sp. L-A4]|uniref:cytochrome c3 family protein n=1 Tax=Breoghania sp. L-A4 TaxID=2304600 RepID=UPI0013C31B63|nr:cytochrome c3 family protein [Breoghania sp. L-A4]
MTQALQARGPKDESWPHRISFPAPQNTSASGDAQIFCATCHEEHQGIANLTAVGNDRCQTCHVSKFGAFATSHPQFTEYPFNRRTRIIFDHKSHFGIHFPKTAEAPAPGQTVPGVCTDCHEPGPGRRYMEIGSFESMCTSCHNGDILGTTRAMGPKGIDFLGVPGLDVATLTARGVDIGVWPDAAEAGMTAFLKTLLLGGGAHDGSGDIREAIAAADSLDLLDLREASDADLARIAELAWSVKRLFNRLETTPLSEVITLPGDAMGTDMDRMQMAWMTGLLPHDVIRAANRDWFPGLGEELQRHAGGAPTQAFEDARAALEPAATPVAGTGDAANNVPANEAPSDDILGNDASATGDDILGGADDAILGGDTSSPGEPADAGLDLLGLPAGADVPAETPASADDILGGTTAFWAAVMMLAVIFLVATIFSPQTRRPPTAGSTRCWAATRRIPTSNLHGTSKWTQPRSPSIRNPGRSSAAGTGRTSPSATGRPATPTASCAPGSTIPAPPSARRCSRRLRRCSSSSRPKAPWGAAPSATASTTRTAASM